MTADPGNMAATKPFQGPPPRESAHEEGSPEDLLLNAPVFGEYTSLALTAPEANNSTPQTEDTQTDSTHLYVLMRNYMEGKLGSDTWNALDEEVRNGLCLPSEDKSCFVARLPPTLKDSLCRCAKRNSTGDKRGRHNAGCPLSCSDRILHSGNRKVFRPHTEAGEVTSSAPVNQPFISVFDEPINSRELLMLPSRHYPFIPRNARALVASAAAAAFGAPTPVRWWMIIALGKLVLSHRTGISAVESLKERARLFCKQEPFADV